MNWSNSSVCESGSSWSEGSRWILGLGHPLVMFLGLGGNSLAIGLLWRNSAAQSSSQTRLLQLMLVTHSLYLILSCTDHGVQALSDFKYSLSLLLDCNVFELFRGTLKVLSAWTMMFALIDLGFNRRGSKRRERTPRHWWFLVGTTVITLGFNWHAFGGLYDHQHSCIGRIPKQNGITPTYIRGSK